MSNNQIPIPIQIPNQIPAVVINPATVRRGRPPLTQEVKDKRAADKETAKSNKASKKQRKE